MFISRVLPAALAVMMALPAAAQDDNPILTQMAALIAAYNAGDSAGVAAIYADDGAIFAPSAPASVGREAVAAHYGRALEAGVSDMKFQVSEIRSYGQGAVEIGESSVTLNGKQIISRYMHVWEKKDDDWLLARDIYNVIGTIE
ncbi:SgcJ/EcaC family oxidoreductase [Alphaproteobacteria bacterium KMM 3653]|uniref:SgcJ/EcaC family oxidoreductase n=1 Tax=Harenicola maris TaxID=2841044 RepID=A0AAP2G8T1_9RHOB|nr:SgcJ/EcaC family oxidoreductase [Harenicola maris]